MKNLKLGNTTGPVLVKNCTNQEKDPDTVKNFRNNEKNGAGTLVKKLRPVKNFDAEDSQV